MYQTQQELTELKLEKKNKVSAFKAQFASCSLHGTEVDDLVEQVEDLIDDYYDPLITDLEVQLQDFGMSARLAEQIGDKLTLETSQL